jgi:hypothetical protein
MSDERNKFHETILAKNYEEAAMRLNGLNMEEMLLALASIGNGDPDNPKEEKNRDKLTKAAEDKFGEKKLNWKGSLERIKFALNVLNTMQVPVGPAPGDLEQTGQVADARKFVTIPTIIPRLLGNADDAAVTVIRAINPTSIAQNREFVGIIFQQGKRFGFTTPTRSPDETAATPVFTSSPGTTIVAVYHTHGAGFERKNRSTAAESFSFQDRGLLDIHHVKGYLGTPRGHILKYVNPPVPTPIPGGGRVVPLF